MNKQFLGALFTGLSAKLQRERAQTQMTLGELIEALGERFANLCPRQDEPCVCEGQTADDAGALVCWRCGKVLEFEGERRKQGEINKC